MKTTLKENLDAIGEAIGRIPSGCSILTVEYDGRSTGVLVSWVQQAAFEPPTVTVCLKHGRAVVELIEGSQRFLLNVIGKDPSAMFKHFGRGYSLEADAFAGLATRATDFGPLIESCIAHLGCEVSNKVPVGDHDLYVAEVVAAESKEGEESYTHLRRNGLTY